MLIFLSIFAFLTIARSNSYLLGYELLNIDESQMMANAVRFHLNNYNIFEFDGTSSGFINSLVLNWPNIFGFDVTFLSTRITAIFLISLTFFFCYKYFKIETNKKLSLLLILPGLLLFSLTNDPDYVHYSSELISTLFIVIFLYGYKKFSKSRDGKFFYIGLILIGLIFFTKTQIIPTAVVLLFSVCLYNLITRDFKIIVKSLILFFSPILLIYLILYLNENFYDYYLNYFEFSKAVVSKYSVGENINYNSLGIDISSTNNLKNYLFFNSVFHYFYFQIIILISILILILIFRKNFFFNLLDINILLVGISVIMVFISILITGAIYRHYFIPLIPLSTLFVGSILIKNLEIVLKLKFYKAFFCFLSFLYLATFFFEGKKFYALKFKKTKFHINNLNFDSPKILEYLEIENGKMLIWGWNPQLYVLSYFMPSDRATISQKYIDDYSNSKYFDNRLLNDITINKPDLIFDYVKPKSFLYNKQRQNIKNSILIETLNNEYLEISKLNDNCPDMYLSKEQFDKLKKRVIEYELPDPRFNNLNNYSVTKEICEDHIIFDKDNDDNLILKLNKKAKIKKIYILSSHLNENSIDINFKIKMKNNVYSNKVVLKKYPFWTKIILDNQKEAEEVILNISNLKKMKYGLNEIKIFKD